MGLEWIKRYIKSVTHDLPWSMFTPFSLLHACYNIIGIKNISNIYKTYMCSALQEKPTNIRYISHDLRPLPLTASFYFLLTLFLRCGFSRNVFTDHSHSPQPTTTVASMGSPKHVIHLINLQSMISKNDPSTFLGRESFWNKTPSGWISSFRHRQLPPNRTHGSNGPQKKKQQSQVGQHRVSELWLGSGSSVVFWQLIFSSQNQGSRIFFWGSWSGR